MRDLSIWIRVWGWGQFQIIIPDLEGHSMFYSCLHLANVIKLAITVTSLGRNYSHCIMYLFCLGEIVSFLAHCPSLWQAHLYSCPQGWVLLRQRRYFQLFPGRDIAWAPRHCGWCGEYRSHRRNLSGIPILPGGVSVPRRSLQPVWTQL